MSTVHTARHIEHPSTPFSPLKATLLAADETAMRLRPAMTFVEDYLYRARGHCALEQSVLAEGERRGFSAAKLRRAGIELGIDVTADCWVLPAGRVQPIEAELIRSLSVPSAAPAVSAVAPAPVVPGRIRISGPVRRAA